MRNESIKIIQFKFNLKKIVFAAMRSDSSPSRPQTQFSREASASVVDVGLSLSSASDLPLLPQFSLSLSLALNHFHFFTLSLFHSRYECGLTSAGHFLELPQITTWSPHIQQQSWNFLASKFTLSETEEGLSVIFSCLKCRKSEIMNSWAGRPDICQTVGSATMWWRRQALGRAGHQKHHRPHWTFFWENWLARKTLQLPAF